MKYTVEFIINCEFMYLAMVDKEVYELDDSIQGNRHIAQEVMRRWAESYLAGLEGPATN